MTHLTLPWPPSINGYWRSIQRGKGTRQIISAKGREYREKAIKSCSGTRAPSGEVAVVERFYPPDRRRRDMDNHRKAYRDAMTEAGVWGDDSLVKMEYAVWMPPVGRERARVDLVIMSVNDPGILIEMSGALKDFEQARMD